MEVYYFRASAVEQLKNVLVFIEIYINSTQLLNYTYSYTGVQNNFNETNNRYQHTQMLTIMLPDETPIGTMPS